MLVNVGRAWLSWPRSANVAGGRVLMPTNSQLTIEDIVCQVASLSNKIGDLTVELRRDLLDIEHQLDDLRNKITQDDE